MIVEYDSNNSGGDWWLKDADWALLELHGWTVNWKRSDPYYTKPGGFGGLDKDGRWLGALATSATKDFPSIADAIAEWERLTGQCADDEGCNCCGAPHSFSAKTEDDKTIYYERPEREGRSRRNA